MNPITPTREPSGGTAFDPSVVRKGFSRFPSGVAAVSAIVDEEPVVLIAWSFQVGISLDPPLALFAAAHSSTSWLKLRACSHLGISVMAAEQGHMARQLGGEAADRFAGVDTTTTPTGAHLINGAALHLECGVHAVTIAGDHDLVLLRVHAVDTKGDIEPLVWYGSDFRTLSPSNPAPRSPRDHVEPQRRGCR